MSKTPKELVMDTSKNLFKLDKTELNFNIKSLDNVPPSSFSDLGELEIICENLVNEYLAFRILTKKKCNYCVTPNNFVLNPNEKKIIKIKYYNKPEELKNFKTEENKFKLEAFIIPENRKNDDVKEIFTEYIKNRVKVYGNFMKLYVKLTEDKSTNYLNLNKNNPKINNFKEKPIAIMFKFGDKEINFALACYKSDIFSKIENEFYEEYPELKLRNISFTTEGAIIDKSKTIEQNKIKNSSIIIVNFND